jgi:hypothetical protein
MAARFLLGTALKKINRSRRIAGVVRSACR